MSAILYDHASPNAESVPLASRAPVVRPGRCVRLVSLLSAFALVPMIIAHVIGASVVNPLTDPISWYAFVPGGGAMIMVGGALLAILGALITFGMYRGRLVSGPLPAIAMAIFCVAMILVGAFPTSPPHAAPTIGATIHRVSAGTAFAILPLVGLMIARSVREPRTLLPRRLRRAAYVMGTLVGLFLAIHLPLAFAGSGIAAFGLLERAGFVIMISYLFLLGATVDQESVDHEKVDSPKSSRRYDRPPSLSSAARNFSIARSDGQTLMTSRSSVISAPTK